MAAASLKRFSRSRAEAPFPIASFTSISFDRCKQLLNRPSEVNLNLLQEEQKGSLIGEMNPIVPRNPFIVNIRAAPGDFFSTGSSLPRLLHISFASDALKKRSL